MKGWAQFFDMDALQLCVLLVVKCIALVTIHVEFVCHMVVAIYMTCWTGRSMSLARKEVVVIITGNHACTVKLIVY